MVQSQRWPLLLPLVLIHTIRILLHVCAMPAPTAHQQKALPVIISPFTRKQSWVHSGVAHIEFRVYSGVEYSHVYSTQLNRICECILNTPC